MGKGDLERVALLASASLSAGIHAGLAPEHLREWAPLGGSFVAAAVVVSAGLVVHALRPTDPRPALALGLALGGLIVAYAATRLTALPPLDPDREPADALGIGTCVLEAVGVLAALRLTRMRGFGHSPALRSLLLRGGSS